MSFSLAQPGKQAQVPLPQTHLPMDQEGTTSE